MKCFIVNGKDLFNEKINPDLSLSVTDIIENKKIKKRKLSCDDCRKCGEITCGNDTEHLSCFERR